MGWKHRGQAIVWLLIGILAIGAAPVPRIALRIHLQAEEDQSGHLLPVRIGEPEELIQVHATPEVTEHDLIAVEPYTGPMGESGARLHFKPHATLLLNTDTLQNPGKILVVFLNGRVVYSPVIDVPLSQGELLLPRGIAPAELGLLQTVARENRHQ